MGSCPARCGGQHRDRAAGGPGRCRASTIGLAPPPIVGHPVRYAPLCSLSLETLIVACMPLDAARYRVAVGDRVPGGPACCPTSALACRICNCLLSCSARLPNATPASRPAPVNRRRRACAAADPGVYCHLPTVRASGRRPDVRRKPTRGGVGLCSGRSHTCVRRRDARLT
jgi:hypothetical protein